MSDFDRIVSMLEAAPKKLDYETGELANGGRYIQVNQGYVCFFAHFTFDKEGKFVTVEAFE